ncbi:roquin-2 isoform X2 [Neocloeon triangulifer]|nr:roquin-2 isoform X2 [Neocloeon triangulifer]
MPIQAPQWTEFLTCPVCCNEFDPAARGPISLGCGHTVCRSCLFTLHRKQCPFDQYNISSELENLPINHAILQLLGAPLPDNDFNGNVKHLNSEDLGCYRRAKKCIEDMALYLKPFPGGTTNALSRPMQKKLVTLINCQLLEEEGRTRAMRAARSLGERSVTELILHHQNPQQLSANLWAAVRARGCQFLGPAMQEEVLRLVLLALEDGSALSRKVLVMFVVQRLEPHFPQASKTSIGHVVQLLYRASCFKVSKREGDSSLMQLKEEFRNYEALRREHDAQIVQIATEAGLRIAPDQWSSLLYGDAAHKSHMQSIMDKLQTPQSFSQSVQELMIALQRTGDPGGLLGGLRNSLELLAAIDPCCNPTETTGAPTWLELAGALEAARTVGAGLVRFLAQHGGMTRKPSDGSMGMNVGSRYKVSMCRDLVTRGVCPRTINCTFAHSEEELERYRAKNRKSSPRAAGHKMDGLKEKGLYQSPENHIFSPNSARDGFMPMPGVGSSLGIAVPRSTVECGPYSSTYPPGPQQQFQPSGQAYQPASSKYPVDFSSTSSVFGGTAGQMYTQGQTDFLQRSPMLGDVAPLDIHYRHYVPRSDTRSKLASLKQRRHEILSQIEKMVGHDNSDAPSPSLMPLSAQTNSELTAFSIWANNKTGQDYRDSVNRYGPISPSIHRPLQSTTSLVDVKRGNQWYYQQPQEGVVGGIQRQSISPENQMMPNYIDPLSIMLQTPSPEQHTPVKSGFIDNPRKMQEQIRSLEKKINDLRFAYGNEEGERLAQELRQIEHSIIQQEQELKMKEEEDSYERHLVDDMREFALRWESELEQEEKRWSSEEEHSAGRP